MDTYRGVVFTPHFLPFATAPLHDVEVVWSNAPIISRNIHVLDGLNHKCAVCFDMCKADNALVGDLKEEAREEAQEVGAAATITSARLCSSRLSSFSLQTGRAIAEPRLLLLALTPSYRPPALLPAYPSRWVRGSALPDPLQATHNRAPMSQISGDQAIRSMFQQEHAGNQR